MGLKVLSLFDGMIAFRENNIDIDRYVAYEIDEYAVQTSKHNFPMIEQCGDVFKADFTQYEGFDFVVGGSPCTYWSIAKTSGRETTASGMGWDLFSQYVRAIKECKPKYFIYENNYSMSNEIRAMIDKSFGFGAVMINSALVSAQNRQRLYWVGVRQADGSYKRAYVPQPTDLHIYMDDILDTNDSYCMRYERSDEAKQCRKEYEAHTLHHGFRELHELHPRPDGKSNTLSTVLKDNPILTPINLCEDNKAHTIKAGYYKQGIANFITNPAYDATGVAELIDECERVGNMPTSNGDEVTSRQNRIYSTKGKSCTVTTSFNPNYAITYDDDMKVEEATNKGYTDIHPGDCVGMAMEGSKTRRGRNMKYKSNCLTTSNDFYQYMGTLSKTIYEVKDGMITINGRTYPIKLRDGKYIIRKLSVAEASRLQTIPDWYVFPVSDSQAYKMIGNGWTVKVIQYLITCVMNNPLDAISGSTYVGTPRKLF